MTGAYRTPTGGRVDRARPMSFNFDGRQFIGCAGDTLASALLANGVHLVGRSFKYHRPRGILSAGSEEPNALMTIDRGPGRVTPNQRATQQELYEWLRSRGRNSFPSLAFDFGAVNDTLASLFPAGFYYKTFMCPRIFWRHLYEPAIRAASGLGRAPTAPDPDRYAQRFAHCDVLVIGAGPAGLAAALAASAGGARVLVCDEQAELGGSLLAETEASIDGKPAAVWLSETIAELTRHPEVTLFPRTTAFGWFPDNMIGLAERVTDHLAQPDPNLPRERLWQVRARQVVIATGAIERPLVFPGNDRPGVMLADAARTYLARYGVKIGTRALIVTADDSAYAVATALQRAGIAVVTVDLRPEPREAALASRVSVRTGMHVVATKGRLRITAATLSNGETVACDALLMCGGWTPSVHLFSQSRGRLRFDERLGAFVPGQSAANERSAGACNGTFSLAACLEEGYAAGDQAAPARRFVVTGARNSQPCIAPPPAAALGKAFVDFQNDVTVKDLRIAAQEGFHSIEHVKRYTTTGMATDQGKTSNMNALAIVSDILHQPIPQVGHTTFRMPYTPVTFGALAGTARGALFEPVRRTPIQDWAAAHGALFEDVGTWQRARCFPRDSENMHAAVARECRAVRNAVGIFDATTLGKIEVVGPDAAEFLNRLYTGSFGGLATGRCRYGVLLNEAGFVMDDGVIARLAPDRFHVTTTTGGAAGVLHHLEDYLQTEFSELRVWLTSITEQWAVIAVQGPLARQVIAPLVQDIDLSGDAMPHMSVREGRMCDVPARLFRVSFTGELGYEINVPADYGKAVWDAVIASGASHAITPYGTETMHVLRAEKGYIIVGQETDGTVIPADLGLDWAIGKAKPDFVGKRSLTRPDMLRPDRKELVGLFAPELLEEGVQIVADPNASVPVPMLGHVTSAYWSETLRRPIALALLAGGRARVRQTLYAHMPGGSIAVRVTTPVFYDPQGARLHA
ncbi:MAG TPA: sarcosine oxidase subunit alpha family protein [Acetobacteraceae bacterium]|nr:sarcosine oxidase subunit alpha family protein [Acetobacteraceae bacterium]